MITSEVVEKCHLISKYFINKIFTIFALNNPNPTTELIYNSDFELLIAVVLSAQSTDIAVNKVTSSLFQVANTPTKIFELKIEGLIPYIKSIGLYKNKAKNIINLCEKLINKFNSKVPSTFDELVSLDGVGRKTANVILNTLYKHNRIAVDTHVFRVSNRIGITNSTKIIEVENQLLERIPLKFQYNAHHWLILHGRYICKAKKPLCKKCVISKYCKFIKEN